MPFAARAENQRLTLGLLLQQPVLIQRAIAHWTKDLDVKPTRRTPRCDGCIIVS